MRLSLQDAPHGSFESSPLLGLRDGEFLDPGKLGTLLPSIGTVTWGFAKTPANDGWQLTAITDGIQVTLSMNDADGLEEVNAEGKLRGAAARLVVALSYAG